MLFQHLKHLCFELTTIIALEYLKICEKANLVNVGDHHYILIISHSRSTVVLLNTGTPGTSRELYSEEANGDTRTRNPSVINRML